MKLAEALEIVARTDPGMVRPHNEDAVFGNAGEGLAILADGMGGYNAGEVASSMAATLLANNLSRLFAQSVQLRPQDMDADNGVRVAHRVLGDELAATNAAILHAAQSQAHYAGMGTTLVMAWFYDNLVTVAHIGDSRMYRLRGDDFRAITRDHSFLQEQLDSGLITQAEARVSQNRNLVTRALGVTPQVVPEMQDFEVQPGDVYLLCSDGLNDMVEDRDMARILLSQAGDLERAAELLIRAANDNGGRDNVSVILVKVRGDFARPRGWWHRLLGWWK